MTAGEARAWEEAYRGTPTWDVGHPQTAFLRAAAKGLLRGDVLDVGCGTGVHARYLAERGHQVVGVDVAAAALERAAAGPPTAARFVRADVRALDAAGFGPEGEQFDTVLDVGCFHTLRPADRGRYADSVGGALRANGHLVLICWSEANPPGFGPNRVSQAEIRQAFGVGWRVASIETTTLDTNMAHATVLAWLAVVSRGR
jgi:SAM-dependent methyltransferase